MRMIPSNPTFAKNAKVDWIRAKGAIELGSLGLRTKTLGRKEPSQMMIIGCDFHPRLATGELVGDGERRVRGTEAGACLAVTRSSSTDNWQRQC
jgi:hypothetical protein